NAKFSFTKRLKFGLVGSLLISMVLLAILALSVSSKNQQINKTKNNAENLISFILFDLKDKLAPLGRVDLLDLVGSKATQYFASIGVENLSPTSLLHYIKALQIVGEVSFTQGEYDKSYLNFSASDVVISDALIQDEQNVALLEKHMLNNYWLGYIKFIKKNYKEAGQFWQKYLMLAQTLSRREPKQQTWLLETSYAFNNLGTLSLASKQLDLANKYFTDSIEIKKSLLKAQPGNQQLIADLADSVSWLGKVQQQEGNLTAKLKTNQESLKLSRELISINPNNPIWLRRLSMALHRVALSFYDFGDLEKSKIFIKESIGLMEPLVAKDPDNFILKQELVNNYLLMVKNYRHQHDFDKALFTIQKSQILVDLFKTNLKFTKKIIQYNINLLVEQALIMSELDQKETALQVLQKAFNLSQNYLKGHEYAVLSVAVIHLSTFKIQQTMPDFNTDGSDSNQQLLRQLHASLFPLIDQTSNNYEAIAMYLYVMRQSHISGIDYDSDFDFEKKLKQLHYRNPDFSSAPFNSVDSELKKAEISLSYN
ncbi:MAG: hypothetical protein L3J52_03380, partial [Proteobacteria bacterium]|nr:hypothetical protein [Pseudomonadota bacterium]